MHLLRFGILLLISLTALACMSLSSPTPNGSSAATRLERDLVKAAQRAERQMGGRLAMAFVDPGAGISATYRGDELFHAASTMKVPVMIEVFRQAEAGKFSLQDTIMLDPVCRSFIDDSPFECEPARGLKEKLHQPVTILELTEQMIVLSDNLATNLLIDECGARRITATMRELGAQRGYVLRGLMDEQAYRAGISNRMTAEDLSALMAAIVEDRAATPESCAQMRRILLDQQYRTMIPKGVPEGIPVGNKTGSITAVRHDTGFVDAPTGPYTLTILMDGVEDGDAATQAAAELSARVYEVRAAQAAAAR